MRRGLIAAGLVTGLLATAACGPAGSSGASGSGGGSTTAGKDGGPQVTITPGDGLKKARPDQGVSVTVTQGTLQTVTVMSKGAAVPGTMSADRTSWRSTWPLVPGAAYQATAVAAGTSGKTTTANASFKALTPASGLRITNVTPNRGQTVGVGMPITVFFNQAVTNKAAVEKGLVITAARPVTGAWNWVNSKEVIFRTKNGTYWPADQKVTFTAHIAGTRVGSTYGMLDVTHVFRIGDKHILSVSAKTDQAVARQNGKVVQSWPVSLGSPAHANWVTTSGIHLTMDHENPAHMDSKWMGVDPKDKAHGGYSEDVPWATRITNSGEYVHQNMDDPSCLGHRNCSHGCVRSTTAGAEWFFKWSYVGDVVIITGTSNPLAWDNGWGYYQKSWSSWLSGSATGKAVRTDGSLPGGGTAGSAGANPLASASVPNPVNG